MAYKLINKKEKRNKAKSGGTSKKSTTGISDKREVFNIILESKACDYINIYYGINGMERHLIHLPKNEFYEFLGWSF